MVRIRCYGRTRHGDDFDNVNIYELLTKFPRLKKFYVDKNANSFQILRFLYLHGDRDVISYNYYDSKVHYSERFYKHMNPRSEFDEENSLDFKRMIDFQNFKEHN